MYHIGTNGKIRLAPGTYEISRVPVSRYEFVTSGVSAAYPDSVPTTITEKFDGSSNHVETFDVTVESGKTVDVHYYDQVAYYDKFTHVDTKINKFYQLNETTKANETVKGLIVRYDGKAGTSNASIDISTDANFKAKLIYVDGSERDLSNKTNITIDANNSHADITVSADGKTITVANSSSHSNEVYTLKAKYNNKFETTFELVFERTP